MVIKSVVFG